MNRIKLEEVAVRLEDIDRYINSIALGNFVMMMINDE